MGWHYQIRKRTGTDYEGERWTMYDIVENHNKHGYTENGIVAYSDTRAGVIRELRKMLADAEHYRTIVEKEN